MSDNLIIREDGIGRLIRGVDVLEIKLQNGGTSRWVRFNPRDQKSVNANGEYHATDDGVDGYRTITVNVPTRTKSQEPGRDQEIFNPDTGTGYYTDDEGMLHEELLPTEIRIMHVPDKTTYQDGEPIDLEGIVVQAYRDGEVWTSAQYPDGYIPVHELSAELLTSDFYRSTGANGESIIWSTGELVITGNFTGPHTQHREGTITVKLPEGSRIYVTYSASKGVVYHGVLQSDLGQSPRGTLQFQRKNSSKIYSSAEGVSRWLYNSVDHLTYAIFGGSSFYFKEFEDVFRISILDDFNMPINNAIEDHEYVVLNSPGGASGKAGDVIVSWHRPKDKKILSAKFGVTVREAS